MAEIAQERVEILRQAANTQQARVSGEFIEIAYAPNNTQFARVAGMYIEVMYLSPVSGGILWNPCLY